MIRSLRCWPLGLVLVALVAAGGCARAPATPPDFSALVARVSPSVVNISANAPAGDYGDTSSSDSGGDNAQTPEWLRKYLQKHPQEEAPAPESSTPPGPDQEGPDQPKSLGSGFILTPDGEVLTNEHVIEGAAQVMVRLSDGRQFSATVLGSDRRSDLALLKIDAGNLPAVKLGNVSQLRVGQWVVAIGSPFGFDYSVTAGIVSAKNRTLDSEPYVPFIQTDAAINPGNSGGPLFNMDGEVVGINSQIYSQTGGFMGVAFAVPIDVAAKVAKELAAHGRVRRGWIGVVVQQVDRGLAASFALSRPRGALITRVLPDSPAQRSGLRVGDIILSYNGVALQSSRDLPPLSGNDDPGKTVDLGVLRNGRRVLIRVQLGELPEPHAVSRKTNPKSIAPGALRRAPPPSIGLTVRDAAPGDRGAGHPPGGVEVITVTAGTARAAGIVPGDILLTIAGRPISSAREFKRILGRLTPGQTVPVLVQRQDGPLFLALQVPPVR